MLAYIESAALGYIIGNIQFAVIFSHLLHRDDVRHHGSGNAGSTNMLRVYGKKDGIITFAGDLLPKPRARGDGDTGVPAA